MKKNFLKKWKDDNGIDMKKKLILKRDRLQESGEVERWFEGRGITASLVKGDFYNEKQLRVSTKKGYVGARGDFRGISDEKLKDKIRNLTRAIK
jgi:hypothetical protein